MRTATRQTAVRETPVREVAETPRKQRLRKNAAMQNQMDLPKQILTVLHEDYGVDVQWVTDAVLGMPTPAHRNKYEINAWEACTADMFGGILDGIFTRKGHKGEITYEGSVLMWRPMELTEEARAEERQAQMGAIEAQARMLKNGQLPGFSPGFEPDHPTAVSKNVMTRTTRPPMDIPKD